MARFFVSRKNVQDKRATIVGEELDHLRRVLRLGPGDHVTLFDDAGWEHETVIRFTGPDHGDLEILRSYQTQRESPLYLTLALGLTKGGKMDFVVEKATELGVQAIAPFFSTYTVPNSTKKKSPSAPHGGKRSPSAQPNSAAVLASPRSARSAISGNC